MRALKLWFPVLLALGAVSGAGAQGADGGAVPRMASGRVGIEPALRTLVVVGPIADTALPEAVVPASGLAGSRSRLLAGTASFFLPGLGSFYAGHARHGVTHMAIHVVAGTWVLAGAASCFMSWGGETGCTDGDIVGAVSWAWLANWGWSIVSAVNDAGARGR